MKRNEAMPPEMDFDTTQERTLERIRNFRLFDDAFMKKMFSDIACTQFLVRAVLEDDELKVISTRTQKELKNLHGHSVILDILAETGDGRMINIEVQRQKEGFSPRRARYHSSMVDSNIHPEGVGYERLKDAYVIIIYERDPLGKGLPLYHVRRTVSELGNMEFNDGAQIILVNGEIINDTLLGMLMHDFHERDPEKMVCAILRDRARYLKADNKGVREMRDITEEFIQDGIEIGREEGIEKNRYETAVGMIKENLAYSLIARITHYDESEIESLAMEVRAKEPEYSATRKN